MWWGLDGGFWTKVQLQAHKPIHSCWYKMWVEEVALANLWFNYPNQQWFCVMVHERVHSTKKKESRLTARKQRRL